MLWRKCHCGSFSCCRAQALGYLSFRSGLSNCGSWALGHQFSYCGTLAQWLPGIWGLPRSGVESVSPVLAGGFFTTKPG